jgi:spore maturation protein CgeB
VAKAGDAEDLANGIEYLVNHPEVALQLAIQAKKEAMDRYCFEQIAREHNDFVAMTCDYCSSKV